MPGKQDSKSSMADRCGKMAAEYDRSKDAQGWRGPELVFGMIYEFTNPGESVLDIGIGTGLGSVLFHKAGLHVYGMDISPEMLEVCRQKGFTKELKTHDLTQEPYPYPNASFHHVVCIGVLNHFEHLHSVFRETSRLLKDNGIFAFIVADRKGNEKSSFEVEHDDSPRTMFRHSKDEICTLLSNTHFSLLKELAFPVWGHREEKKPLSLKAYAARRQERIEPADAGDV